MLGLIINNIMHLLHPTPMKSWKIVDFFWIFVIHTEVFNTCELLYYIWMFPLTWNLKLETWSANTFGNTVGHFDHLDALCILQLGHCIGSLQEISSGCRHFPKIGQISLNSWQFPSRAQKIASPLFLKCTAVILMCELSMYGQFGSA